MLLLSILFKIKTKCHFTSISTKIAAQTEVLENDLIAFLYCTAKLNHSHLGRHGLANKNRK